MKHSVAPYLAPMTAFGPLFMVIGQSRHSGDLTLTSLMMGVLPILGATLVSIGVTLLLRVVMKQQKELTGLRAKLEMLERK